jgi:hypothetical protein
MSVRSFTGAGGRLAGLAAVAVALAGLFAMHGLSPHGSAHSSSTPMSEATSMHADDGTDLPGSQLPAGGDGDDLLALCLALLVAGVVGLAARGRPIRVTVRNTSRAGRVTSPATARRYRDPPDLHALSILRC